MVGRKAVRTRGKLQFSRFFQKLKEGDFVSISKEKTVASSFPERFQGRTGQTEEKRGKSWIIKVNDGNKEKRLIVHPIHLKKIKKDKKG